MKKVTGIGGVFFKAGNPQSLREWYRKHLGLDMQDWGAYFDWIDPSKPDAAAKARTIWSAFDADTDYFDPSKKAFMINYRVENLEQLLETLRAEGVTIVGKVEHFPYGKFGWIMDEEGNKIELWEPIDEGF